MASVISHMLLGQVAEPMASTQRHVETHRPMVGQ